jgi:carboxyvinyl-carboxyphosphonate phosphorylmutase
VFDAVSARLAQAAGFEFGLLGGSIAAAVVAGAPDIGVITPTEFTDQARRVTRGSDLPLLVDGDDGYGNALVTRRTVEGLEAAGVCAIMIEDVPLGVPYSVGRAGLTSKDEYYDKLRAAVEARIDPSLVIVGRTAGNREGGIDELIERVRLCERAGAEAVLLLAVQSLEDIAAVHASTSLPLIGGAQGASDEELVANGVRLSLTPHVAYFAMIGSLYESFVHLRKGGSVRDLQARRLPPELQSVALGESDYDGWMRDYLKVEGSSAGH